MAVSTRENGSIITWMASACTPGRMVDNIEVSTKMTRSTDTAFIHGQMVEPTLDTGAAVSSMDSGPTTYQANRQSSASGKKAKE